MMPLSRRAALLLALAAFSGVSFAQRTVVDMAGRSVTVPDHIGRTATVGAGPVLDSFLAALGVGGTVVNGMPATARSNQADCCRFLPRVIPGLMDRPTIEGAGFVIDREMLLALRPDVVLMHGEASSTGIAATGLRSFVVLLVREREATPVEAMTKLGELYGRPERAKAYAHHFAGLLNRVRHRLGNVGSEQRPRTVYFNYRTFSMISMTADWWIDAAGGRSVTRALPLQNGRATFSIEQLLDWDPQVVFAGTPAEVDEIMRDGRLAGMAAVRARRVHAVPRSVIRWAHPSPEQAVGVLWAAHKLYPERFAAADVERELRAFYRDFYVHELSDADVRDILHYGAPEDDR